ncbi:unnamed protein product [Durusdinium trenchii]|uniref:Uncharacterized protein n=2 Tax=Durusdinium trenchii TaxID=1381693 RepID=A0ABP0HIH4_9DINO
MLQDSIRKISLEDVPAFMKLQDEFVLEHHALTQKLYDKATLTQKRTTPVSDPADPLKPGYRSRGFVLTGVVWEYLGHQEDAHLVAYKVMQRLTKSESVKSDKAILFRSEVIGEVVGIQYPDGSGPFDVTIRGWIESEQLHMVDSKSLSTWNGERFTDLIDFNEAFTSGRAAFHRKLSLVMRDVEMTKMLAKKVHPCKR